MKKINKVKFLLISLIILSVIYSVPNIVDKFNYNNIPKSASFWNLANAIYIDDDDPNFNWTKTAAQYDWCSGSGTINNPYRIENVTIDGVISGSCIHIRNSKVYFIIKNCTLVNIRVGQGYDSAIRLNYVNNGTILENNCSNNSGAGIYLGGCCNNTISNNKCNKDTWLGIFLDEGSNNNTVYGNTLNYSGFGIYKSHYNNVSRNTISQPPLSYSEYFHKQIVISGNNNSFSGNKFINCGFYLSPGSGSPWVTLDDLCSNKIDQTNTVNDKPVYYYKKKNFLTRDNFSNAGQVILAGCNHCKISNLTISDGTVGISLYYSNNNTIFNNSLAYHFPKEILLFESQQNNISENFLTNIGLIPGIHLYQNSDENLLKNNHIKDCYVGVEVSSSNNNNITGNYLIGNGRGMTLASAENNILKGNHLINNTEVGIGVWGNNNTFYLNQFFNNEVNAYDYGNDNSWDNGSIGNYWDDYSGTDDDDDGIGDSPYMVSGSPGNIDNFPIWDDGHNGSIIVIDTRTSKNWSWASEHTWCSGSGTYSDPYIIKDCIINGNNNSFGIEILFSTAYFKIINCKVYNSTYYSGFGGGIRFEYVDNGTLINNNCSENYCSGIYLNHCNNITIKENILNNNNYYSYDYIGNYGIKMMDSNNISIISNEIKGNYYGFLSSLGEDIRIFNNTIESNVKLGINLGSDFSLVKNNIIFNNFQRGLRINGNNITVASNEIFNHQWGIDFSYGSNNTIVNNSIHENTYGIEVYGTESSTNCYFNTFYNNQLYYNFISSIDNGAFNDWDKDGLGNYWDDYSGRDDNDDGIGEDPYIITGFANSQDNFPIWDDGHNGSKIVIDDSASNNWDWAKTRTWCSGSGTFADPYLIKDCIIDGKALTSCIEISNSIVYFRIENCNLFNCSSGQAGIKLAYVLNGNLLNNNCSNNIGHGIYLHDSHNNTILGNIINYNDEFGIFLEVSDNNNLSRNVLNENFYGIYLGLSENNTISENSANNNDWQGIYLSSSSNNNKILNNNLTYNDDNGILIDSSNYNNLFGNIVDNNDWNGILLWKSYSNAIRANIIRYNAFAGVYFYRSNNTDIIENTFIGNLHNIYEIGCENNNFVLNYYDGILTPFVIDNNGGGDLTWLEAANLFIWCTGSGSYSDPYIIQNLIIDGQNSSSCIEIRDSNVYFIILNCTLYNSGTGLYNAGIELANVINGQLITNNCSYNNGHGIGLYQSQNITIDGNIAANNEEFGIFLEVSNNNTLSGNTLNENSNGIYLGLSNNNTISENSAFNNDQRGIYLSSDSNFNTILNNNLSYSEEGIFISYSHNNTVSRNKADYNDYGIWVWYSNNNTIIGNTLSNNDLFGLYLYRSNKTDVISNTFIVNLYKNIDEFESVNNYFKWNYLDGIFSPFVIDNDGGGDFTWGELKDLFFWCKGSGIWSDPYIMNNINIDAQNSSSCIEIRDSTVFFKIEGCTLYNSSSGLYNAGIKIINVINGQLIDNDCSYNNGVGIGLYQSQNVTIDGNIVNNNDAFGIFLEGSHNNILSGNTLNENSDGMYLGLSNNNTISQNSAFNNNLRGIYVSSSSNNNTIMNNNVTYNGDNGIDIYDGHDTKVVGNIAENNGWNGIFVWKCNDATVARNIANYNTFAGLYLWSSNSTEVIGNVFMGNLYNIYESDGESNIFNWNIDNGFTDPIIIDDSGTGDFTWVECINQLAWIYGSGTLSDPYIIELITIDGLNLTSCLTIRNSNVYFKIQNCTFYNSGDDLYDGGIKLVSASNGELIYNNCSFNNANGIILDSCQSIIITENSINNNEFSGIVLIDSNNIDIINNKATINSNGQYGILLDGSDDNEISNNTINFNQIGIYLINSNNNHIAYNDLLYNILEAINIESGEGNTLEGNLIPREPSEFPFEILIIILIIGIVAVGITGSVLIIKKRRSFVGLKEKEVSEKKKDKIRAKLEGKLEFVDYLIRERNIKLAYKNLGKIQDTADMYDFFDIFNKANEKIERCKEIEAGISKPVIKEEVAPPVKEREIKEVVIPPPIIKKEEEKKYNLFISYSTVDRDYFQIEKIVEELKKYSNISQISYWERDSKANIVEFMDETLEVSNTFLLFCSEHSVKSKAVKDEWQAAFQMRKEGLIKLIPVYEDQKHIPKILWHLLNVQYDKDNFSKFIENLYKEIMREY